MVTLGAASVEPGEVGRNSSAPKAAREGAVTYYSLDLYQALPCKMPKRSKHPSPCWTRNNRVGIPAIAEPCSFTPLHEFFMAKIVREPMWSADAGGKKETPPERRKGLSGGA